MKDTVNVSYLTIDKETLIFSIYDVLLEILALQYWICEMSASHFHCVLWEFWNIFRFWVDILWNLQEWNQPWSNIILYSYHGLTCCQACCVCYMCDVCTWRVWCVCSFHLCTCMSVREYFDSRIKEHIRLSDSHCSPEDS